MTLAEQIAQIVENAERAGELVEGVSTAEQNLAAFIAECDALGIQSQPDDSTKE